MTTCRADSNSTVADAAPRRLPWTQSSNGWLFAVALGMQEQKGSAIARSLVPIAVGHALAIGSVVLATAFLGMTLPLAVIR